MAAALAQALQKLPADRFDSARAFADALADVHFTTGAVGAVGGSGPVSVRSVLRSPVTATLAAALVIVAVFAGVQWHAAHRPVVASVVRFQVPLLSTQQVANTAPGRNVAVSPDGQTLAYAVPDSTGASHLYVRRLDEEASRMVPSTDGAQQPAFSPDGRWVAYSVGTVVWKVQVSGGAPVRLADPGTSPTGLSWSPSGVIVDGLVRGLAAIPQGGGTARLIAKPDTAAGELYFNQPHALPDGKSVLFSIQPSSGANQTQLAEVSLETGTVRRFHFDLMDVTGYAGGTLVYVLASGPLMAVPFDLETGKPTGNPLALGPRVVTTLAGASMSAMSPTGTLVYEPTSDQARLGWVNLQGQFTPLQSKPQAYAFPRLSPDGKRIAMSIGAEGRSDIWLYDIASGTPTRITSAGALNDRPEWSPDGRRVLYRSDRSGRPGLWWEPADQSALSAPLETDPQHNYYEGVISPDGKYLVYQMDDAGARTGGRDVSRPRGRYGAAPGCRHAIRRDAGPAVARRPLGGLRDR